MDIRAYKPKDVETVKRLFEQFGNKDLEVPDFSKDHLCAFTVVDNNNSIITAGGVRTIAEICLVTDKEKTVRQRMNALFEVLAVSKHIAREFNFQWLHAITDDPTWASQMKANGFLSRGEDLEIHVEDIK
jgi:hypothetical protein